MNYTENLGLLKPETTELFDVQHANSNAEILDAAIALKASLEQVATMLEEIIETGEITEVDIGAVTTIREFINNTGFRIGVGTTAQIAQAETQGLIPENSLVIPTDGTDVADFEQALTDIGNLQTDVTALQTATADSGWQTITMTTPWTSGGITMQCRKIGKRVYVHGRAEHDSQATESKLVGTLPEGYRPGNAGGYGMVYSLDGSMISTCIVQSSGVLQLSTLFSLAYPTTAQTYPGKTIVFDFGFFVAE